MLRIDWICIAFLNFAIAAASQADQLAADQINKLRIDARSKRSSRNIPISHQKIERIDRFKSMPKFHLISRKEYRCGHPM